MVMHNVSISHASELCLEMSVICDSFFAAIPFLCSIGQECLAAGQCHTSTCTCHAFHCWVWSRCHRRMWCHVLYI